MKPASLSKSELLCVCCSVVVGVGWLSCGLVELFLFTDPMSFRSRGRIVPGFSSHSEHVELYVLTSLPPCSFLQYGDNPSTVQFPSWRMSKLLTDWEPESTASQMGLENAFHHSLLHTFLLCHIRAPIMMSLSPGCGRP